MDFVVFLLLCFYLFLQLLLSLLLLLDLCQQLTLFLGRCLQLLHGLVLELLLELLHNVSLLFFERALVPYKRGLLLLDAPFKLCQLLLESVLNLLLLADGRLQSGLEFLYGF